MNKKAIMKYGVISLLFSIVLVGVFISILPFSTGLDLNEVYVLDEPIRVDFSNSIGQWCDVKTISPIDTSVRRIKNWLVFRPREVGAYQLEISSCNDKGSYSFEVVESFAALEAINYNGTGSEGNNEAGSEEYYVQETTEVNLDEPVKWRLRTKNKTIDFKESASNFKYFQIVDGKKESYSRFRIYADRFSTVEKLYEVEYETPPPVKIEKTFSKFKKEVVISSDDGVHYENIRAYSSLDEVVFLDEKDKFNVYWKEGDRFLEFNVSDEDGDGLVDRIEWVFPHLSTQTFIIEISSAIHLDGGRNFIENIYDKVYKKDNIWVLIPDGDFVRVNFEENLTRDNDITLYAKSAKLTPSKVEVYEVNSTEKIAEFPSILGEGFYKIFLTNMISLTQHTFDLKIIGDILIDLIIDPITGGSATGGLRPQSVSCIALGVSTTCDGTYPTSCPGSGGTDYLSCDDGSVENHETRKGDVMSVSATYYDTSVTDCVSITSVSLCWEWSTDNAVTSCIVNVDNDADSTWSSVSSACPAANTCSDVSLLDGGWTCDNFFGASGTRAEARIGATRTENNPALVAVDQLWFNVSYIIVGSLDVNLTNPSTVVINNETIYQTFYVNATVDCNGLPADVCGDVNATLRYNATASPDTPVSVTPGATPFFANTGNITCSNLHGLDTCNVGWTLNATQAGSYLLDVIFESNYSQILVNDTLNSEFSVSNVPWLSVDIFPKIDPVISERETFGMNCSTICNEQSCTDVIVNLFYCNSSTSCTPNTLLDTSSYGLFSNVNSVSLGTMSAGSLENASFVLNGTVSADYVVACNVSGSNVLTNNSLPSNLTLHVNDFPVALFTYPSSSEWLSSTEILNASDSFDSDGTLTNYAFEIDDNIGFSSPSTVCDSASTTCSLNTVTQTECSLETSSCYLRLNVTDDDSKEDSVIIQVGIDNVVPTITLDSPLNWTFISSESQTVNATSIDSGSGTHCVIFEAYFDSSWTEINVDCAAPFSYSWDLSGISDQNGIEVRARANDSEGNMAGYNTHYNITHDTIKPYAIIDTLADFEIINTTTYLLNGSSSYDETSGIINTSWYFYNATYPDGFYIGSDSNPALGWTYLWDLTGISDGGYNVSLNVTDNASLENGTFVTGIIIDLENTNPTCTVIYPNGDEYLKGIIVINSTVVESDPSDYVNNVSFEYSDDFGVSWNLIGYNTTSDISSYTLSWDSSLGVDSRDYFVRCNATDSRNGEGSDTTNNNFSVDNTAPSVTFPAINNTIVETNTFMCLNVTASDNLLGVDSVLAEVDCPSCGIINLTLLDDGSGCDTISGDFVYSTEYLILYAENYNWTYSSANDSVNNLNKSLISLNWTGFSFSYLIAEMLDPTVFFEINESGLNTNFTVECNITCNQSGSDCNAVDITTEYLDIFWFDITTGTTTFLNDEDSYYCGDLLSGESCIHVFNISAQDGSGGFDYDVRCHGSSSNAAADISSSVNFHVNDFPIADFYYPVPSEWLSSTETLNASDSSDSDGSITIYSFEIDDNDLFSNPTTICSGASDTCSLNTITQIECSQETSGCYLRLNVTDDDFTKNSTIIQVGIDNTPPNITLDLPVNFTNITTESQIVNATEIDLGSLTDCVIFETYYDSSWTQINVDCAAPYSYNWDLSSISDQNGIEVRARANDSEGNMGGYDTHYNITHDTTPPNVNLVDPFVNAFLNYTDVVFNFTAIDSYSETLNCTLLVDGLNKGNNVSTLNDTLTSFVVSSLSQGAHEWNVTCEDVYDFSNTSETRDFSIDSVYPVVNFNLPENDFWSNSNNILFNFTGIDDNLESCFLYGNWSSGWHLNETIIVVSSLVPVTTNKVLNDGTYVWNAMCNDSYSNYAFNSTNYTINVDSTFPEIEYNQNSDFDNLMTWNNYVFVNVSATDNNLESVIFEWNGVNETFDFTSGDNYWENKTSLSDGVYTFRAYINDSAGNINVTSLRTVTVDLNTPTYSDLTQKIGGSEVNIWHRGEVLDLVVNFSDNYFLNYSWLSTNESGNWVNHTGIYNSSQVLFGSNANATYNWTNNSVDLGEYVYWRAYVNDSVGRENLTSLSSFQVWGYSEVSSSYLDPTGIPVFGTSTMNCIVLDNVTSDAISGYTVSFYNNSVLMGTNVTDFSGLASYSFSIDSAGVYQISCNMTDNSTLFYNASSNNDGQETLGVGYGVTTYDFSDSGGGTAYEGTGLDLVTNFNSPIDDAISDLEFNDNINYQTYRAGAGLYAYSRFEFLVTDDLNSITKMNVTWSGFGDVGAGTDGYILYFYNASSGLWVQMASYSTNNADQTETFAYDLTNGVFDFINSSGYVKVLSRTFSLAPTGGGAGSRWAQIDNDYVKLDVYTDILAPNIELLSPVDTFNTSALSVDFICNATDDYRIKNVSLYASWNSAWHLNETNSSGLNSVNTSFTKDLVDGTYDWNCYACDNAGNCQFASFNRTINYDTVSPEVNLIYPIDTQNFSSAIIPSFNFSVTDNFPLANCSLYGDFAGPWSLNETMNTPVNDSGVNFGSKDVIIDDYYIWNVECSDYAGNKALNSTNFSFSAFLPPEEILDLNTSQDINDGTGDLTLDWNDGPHADSYRVYSTDSLSSPFTLLAETYDTNYTDTTSSGVRRRFYQVSSLNPIGENMSTDIYGKTVYYLKRKAGGNTRNRVGFYFSSNMTLASDFMDEVINISAFTRFNNTIQKREICNDFSCPDIPLCTETNCNFNFSLTYGEGYEIYINSSAPLEVNWSFDGTLGSAINANLVKNATSSGKNWVSMYANTTLTNAQDFIGSVPNADAVTYWNESEQTSNGLIISPFPWISFLGRNFPIEIEYGYEVSVTSSGPWTQE